MVRAETQTIRKSSELGKAPQMGRRKKGEPPHYRLHKQSGQAVVSLPLGDGNYRDILLGTFDTPGSRQEYARVLAEWEGSGQHLRRAVSAVSDLTVNEVAARFWRHAEQHYRHPDGTTTNELHDFKYSLRPLKHLYGDTPAKSFGPLALKAVRELMIAGYEHAEYGPQQALCRGVINQRIGRIRRMFKWAVENELVPPSILHGLQAVGGLQQGRSQARETEAVKPVPEVFVEAILPHVRPPVAAMARLQLLTGMRPGEVCIMRAIDLDMTDKVWLYRPGSDQGAHGAHKTAHRGQHRIVPIGPRGQEIIRRWLKPDLYAYLFSPVEAVAGLRAEQRRKRKTKLQPSQIDRRKTILKRKPGSRYRVRSYAVAIARACRKADQAAREKAIKAGMSKEEAEATVFVPHWHPHQVRHTKATEIRREAGLDAARAVLGHRSPKITEIYAEIDVNKAAEVMGRLG
jgi:integrase